MKNVLIRNTSPSLGRLFKERGQVLKVRKVKQNEGRNGLKRVARDCGFKSLKQAFRRTNGAFFT